MSINGLMIVCLSASLAEALRAAAARQGITQNEAWRRIVCGLPGLTGSDLRSLPEPPRKNVERAIKIDLPSSYLEILHIAESIAQISISSVCRRILYALLITRTVHFIAGESSDDFRLELTQKDFEFAEDCERDDLGTVLMQCHRK